MRRAPTLLLLAALLLPAACGGDDGPTEGTRAACFLLRNDILREPEPGTVVVNAFGLPEAIDKADDEDVREALERLAEDLPELRGTAVPERRAEINDICVAAGVAEDDGPDQ